MEHRLIYRNLADYDNVRYNSRTAEANDAQQITQRQAQLAAGGKDVAPVAKVATNQDLSAAKTVYGAAAQGNQSSYQNGQTYNVGSGEIQRGAAQRLIDSGMNPDQVYNQMEKSQGQASQTMTNTGLGAQYDQRGNVIAGSGRLPAQSKADQIEAQLRGQGIADPITIANAKAAALTEETAQMQKDQASKEISDKNAVATATSNAAAGAAASESGIAKTPTAPTTPQDAGLSAAIAGLPPEYAFLGPVLQAQQAEFAKAQADQQALYEKTTGTTDAAYDAIDKRIDGVESSYKAGTEAIQGLLSQVKEQQSKNIDEQEKAAKDRLAWSELQQSREIERNKVKAVDSKVASLALRGGFGSGAGLSEIEETTRSYENALDDLRSEYGVQRTELGAKFTALHNQVFTDYATNSINNIKDMLSAVERIGQQKNASTEARAKAENDALTTLITNQTNLRQQAAKELTNGAKEISNVINQNRDDKRAQEQLGWQRMDWAAKTYGSDTPQEIIDSISKQLPGVDVGNALKTMTLAEMKQMKIKRGGGGTGGGGAYSTGVTGTSSNFTNLNPQQLKDAVNRIFAPANYGGNASERAGKVNEYLGRIASGENLGSIAASLQGDYWASQKGAPRTAHDERVTAQGSMESLQSFADFYGITGDDKDGPLGLLDSKVEGFKSLFKQSSQEYNNLAGQVGNIRARIIKENYGSAVTPQELEIARSYIPDMSDGGSLFLTKLQNLKAYNAYLDAKVFASTTGLPAPKPPQPVTLSGNSMAGPGKYSNDDISSALLD